MNMASKFLFMVVARLRLTRLPRVHSSFQTGLLLLLFGFCASVSAQEVLLSGAQVGTVQLLRQDEGYITISGSNYNFADEVTQVFLGAEQYDSTYLNEGMVVRFTLNRQRVLERIEMIGPANLIKEVTQEH